MKLTRIVATAGVLAAVGIGGVIAAAPASAYPAGQEPVATINSTVFAPGSPVTITVDNFTPGNLTMQIFSAPQVIGRGTVGADTRGSVTGTIPAGFSGDHTIQVVGAGGEIYSVDVTIAGGAGSGSGQGGGSSTGNGSGSGGGLANTGAAVTGIGILGGVLVVGGAFFVVAGRRRHAQQTPSV